MDINTFEKCQKTKAAAITVATQQEWDQAVSLGKPVAIYSGGWEAKNGETVVVRGSAAVTARGTATVLAWERGRVFAFDKVECFAFDRAYVRAEDQVRVTAQDDALVWCFGSSLVDLEGRSKAQASDQCHVFLWSKETSCEAKSGTPGIVDIRERKVLSKEEETDYTNLALDAIYRKGPKGMLVSELESYLHSEGASRRAIRVIKKQIRSDVTVSKNKNLQFVWISKQFGTNLS